MGVTNNQVRFFALCVLICVTGIAQYAALGPGSNLESLGERRPRRFPSSTAPLVPSLSSKKPNKSNEPHSHEDYALTIVYHRLSDEFGLVDPRFSDVDVARILSGIREIWKSAGVEIVFDIKRAVRLEKLDADRARAYLYYVHGHPHVSINRKKTHLLGASKGESDWVYEAVDVDVEKVDDALQRFAQHRVVKKLVGDLRRAQSDETRSDVVSKFFDSRETAAVDYARLSSLIDSKFPKMYSSESEKEFLFKALRNTKDTISPGSIKDALVDVSTKTSSKSRRLWLAFREFYVSRELSVDRTLQFAAQMKTRPMLFLHYAIGRTKTLGDDKTLVRSLWEYENEVHIFPIAHYHDMNGRGSSNWMDVVARTSSCFETSDVHCRWGNAVV